MHLAAVPEAAVVDDAGDDDDCDDRDDILSISCSVRAIFPVYN